MEIESDEVEVDEEEALTVRRLTCKIISRDETGGAQLKKRKGWGGGVPAEEVVEPELFPKLYGLVFIPEDEDAGKQ